MPDSTDPITVIVPVPVANDHVATKLREWRTALDATGRTYDILIVTHDRTIGGDAVTRVVHHEHPLGYGAALRLALAESTHPIVCLTSFDYPYSPSDFPKLLKRLGETVDVYGTLRSIEAVNGVRTGVAVPGFWRFVGIGYRAFCKIALNLPFEPLPGWLGFREHLRSWVLWVIMGVPLIDVHSGFKLVRRSVLDRFPIQSDGAFVFAELFAKMTFLTVLVAEEPLTPSSERPQSPTWGADFGRVLQDAQFHSPVPIVEG